MKRKYVNYIIGIVVAVLLIAFLEFSLSNDNIDKTETASNTGSGSVTIGDSSSTKTTSSSGAIYSSSNLFTTRDLEQVADTEGAVKYTVSSGNDIHISEKGVYILSGTAENTTIYVEADSEAKVQLVLDGLNITNENFPCIYVKTGDKVFITTTASENTLKVTDSFVKDGDVNTDGVVFSRSDIVFNGKGTLTIESTDNGIVSKDDLKVTGGTYIITATSKAIEANDSIRISDCTFTLKAGTDGLHSENNDDNTLGYVYIGGGTFTINAGDDAIHALSVVQIDDGTFTISAAEGIEGTYIQINGGTITINASDDGINAARKSSAYTPTVEINDGNIKITMGQGDTDGIDSNGNIYVNGGTIEVTGNSTFDYDGVAEYNGGTIIVNGEQVDTIPNQMMGGFGGGGMRGFGGMNNSGNMGDMRGQRNFQDMMSSGDMGNMEPPEGFGDMQISGDMVPPEGFGDMAGSGNMMPPEGFDGMPGSGNMDFSKGQGKMGRMKDFRETSN